MHVVYMHQVQEALQKLIGILAAPDWMVQAGVHLHSRAPAAHPAMCHCPASPIDPRAPEHQDPIEYELSPCVRGVVSLMTSGSCTQMDQTLHITIECVRHTLCPSHATKRS